MSLFRSNAFTAEQSQAWQETSHLQSQLSIFLLLHQDSNKVGNKKEDRVGTNARNHIQTFTEEPIGSNSMGKTRRPCDHILACILDQGARQVGHGHHLSHAGAKAVVAKCITKFRHEWHAILHRHLDRLLVHVDGFKLLAVKEH